MKKLFLSLLMGLLFMGSPLAHADTLTVYPDASPETTSVDGYDAAIETNETWTNVVNGAGDVGSDTASPLLLNQINAGSTTDRWARIYRAFILFDTSSIGAATIDSAVLSIYGSSKSDTAGIAPNLNIFSSNPASNTAIVAGDYGNVGSTEFSTDISYASFSTSAYNDFTLNASGEAAIDTGGISKFSTRSDYDSTDSAPTWTSSLQSYLRGVSAENTGTTQDPKLVVNYTPSSFTPRIIIID